MKAGVSRTPAPIVAAAFEYKEPAKWNERNGNRTTRKKDSIKRRKI